MSKIDFWDFSAIFYDMAMKANGRAYADMLKFIGGIVPVGATVLEAAAGTGATSIVVSDKASRILCTDISEKMLNMARKKIKKHSVKNIEIVNRSIYDLKEADSSFDIVIAGHVLHLVDEPEKAAAELRRVAKSMVILPMSFTKGLRGVAKVKINIYRLFGFAPRTELAWNEYEGFLLNLGFNGCEIVKIAGRIPMAVAVYKIQ
ncbi:MAG: class I SAM-dependent methyltransferase [Defluviitaleaceae bacterium]|nr:class I SAM-dependent methyltransferase [Defluviitaleaceae bacterium]